MWEKKYSGEFIDTVAFIAGLRFEMYSNTLYNVLAPFKLKGLHKPKKSGAYEDCGSFGGDDAWLCICDELTINVPNDEEELKRWICAFFEMYGGYPLDGFSDACNLSDSKQKQIAEAIENNIEEIMSDIAYCKISSIVLEEEDWGEGKIAVYEDGNFDVFDADDQDVDEFIDKVGF